MRRELLLMGTMTGALMFWLAACSGSEESHQGQTSAGGGGQGGTSSGASGSSSHCATDKKGPALVEIPMAAGGVTCIDATEVTRAQYAEFVQTTEAAEVNQPSECAFNTTFVAEAECMAYPSVCQGDECGSHPQVCVDWCDAHAYCQWAGKHLCGKVGGGTLSVGVDDTFDATQSEWMNACSSGRSAQPADTFWPYGDTYLPDACNGYGNATTGCEGNGDTCTTVPVGSLPSCTPSGAYSGVFDLSGNVLEWTDSCGLVEDGGEYLRCEYRGGTYEQTSLTLGLGESCVFPSSAYRPTVEYGLGFRCCDD